ncbi:unnamed protein product [Arabis nemorensis]|uniref:Uncharacterized protein n=1 Tax=Arabis nemorensis TaxID=586526 RepID=A0A565CB16_9BRAS|nr:unnamed protein product [Arabis nemorensis]
MAPRKTKADGEEKAKPVTTVSSRVTRSMNRRTRSETQQNGAKVVRSVAKRFHEKMESRKIGNLGKQCNAFKTRAIQVKERLEEAVPGVMVTLNPEKKSSPSLILSLDVLEQPRRGCFEIREEGGETFISLLDMKRPFAPMKALDMEEVIEDIIKKIK